MNGTQGPAGQSEGGVKGDRTEQAQRGHGMMKTEVRHFTNYTHTLQHRKCLIQNRAIMEKGGD